MRGEIVARKLEIYVKASPAARGLQPQGPRTKGLRPRNESQQSGPRPPAAGLTYKGPPARTRTLPFFAPQHYLYPYQKDNNMASVTSPIRLKGAVGDLVFSGTPGGGQRAYLKAHASKKKWHPPTSHASSTGSPLSSFLKLPKSCEATALRDDRIKIPPFPPFH
jgi:hypothetical protein